MEYHGSERQKCKVLIGVYRVKAPVGDFCSHWGQRGTISLLIFLYFLLLLNVKIKHRLFEVEKAVWAVCFDTSPAAEETSLLTLQWTHTFCNLFLSLSHKAHEPYSYLIYCLMQHHISHSFSLPLSSSFTLLFSILTKTKTRTRARKPKSNAAACQLCCKNRDCTVFEITHTTISKPKIHSDWSKPCKNRWEGWCSKRQSREDGDRMKTDRRGEQGKMYWLQRWSWHNTLCSWTFWWVCINYIPYEGKYVVVKVGGPPLLHTHPLSPSLSAVFLSFRSPSYVF